MFPFSLTTPLHLLRLLLPFVLHLCSTILLNLFLLIFQLFSFRPPSSHSPPPHPGPFYFGGEMVQHKLFESNR